MFSIKESRFAGQDCIQLSNGTLTLHALKNAGPRIVGLQINGGKNLLAELPDSVKAGDYILRGGQRVWHGPEDIIRSYQPDGEPVEAIWEGDVLTLVQKPEALTGIQKTISIQEGKSSNELIVDHTLTNHNLWTVNYTVWPICQARSGGFAILPLSRKNTGLLPNRRVVFWPYTDLSSPNIKIGNDYIIINAAFKAGEKTKIGWLNDRGWMGYSLDRTLFVKKVEFIPGGDYIDLGCSMECYCDVNCIELETTSPLTEVAPGGSAKQTETWAVYPDVDLEMTESSINQAVQKLKIQ
jgi:hypothetical protein